MRYYIPGINCELSLNVVNSEYVIFLQYLILSIRSFISLLIDSILLVIESILLLIEPILLLIESILLNILLNNYLI
jgi:hypothetical protein